MTPPRSTFAALATSLLLAACGAETSTDAPPSGPADPAARAPAPPPPFTPAEARLQRLTVSQYTESLRQLFGDALVVPEDLEVDTPLHGFANIGASALSVGPRALEQYEAAARDVAAQVFEDPAWRVALVGCDIADAGDPCVRGFVMRFGRLAWRRALEPAEVDRLTAFATTLGARFADPWFAVQMTTAAILQSPHFLYRVELGVPDLADTRRARYTGAEMASRLAFFLWNGPPDGPLLGAGERGLLDTPEGIADAVADMLEDPRARPAMVRFFDEHLKLDRLSAVTKDREAFPQLTDTLTASMRAEVHAILEHVVFDLDADLRTLFTTRTTFVNRELAQLYDLPPVDGDALVPVELPEDGPRAGVLTTGAFLAVHAHATVTSPTLRGRYVRQSLLCQDIPPPPPGVTTELPEPDPNAGPQTLRQRLEALHLSNETCGGCHQLMDPIGFGFEHFDALGAYRTTDNDLPVDARGALDGEAFTGARSLAEALAEHPAVPDCLSRQAYRYATGHLETGGERRALSKLATDFRAGGYTYRALATAIATSEGFRYAARNDGP